MKKPDTFIDLPRRCSACGRYFERRRDEETGEFLEARSNYNKRMTCSRACAKAATGRSLNETRNIEPVIRRIVRCLKCSAEARTGHLTCADHDIFERLGQVFADAPARPDYGRVPMVGAYRTLGGISGAYE